jgi:hypothetical protein
MMAMSVFAFESRKPKQIILRTEEELKKFEAAHYALEAGQRREVSLCELRTARDALLVAKEPVGHVVRLASIRRVTPANDHYGYWVSHLKEGYLASCGSAMDKAKFTSGYATSYGGHHNGGGAWVGEETENAVTVLTAWKELPSGEALERFQADLKRLEAGEVEEAFFDHPRRAGIHPVYIIDPPYMRILRELGNEGCPPVSWSATPLHDDEVAGYRLNRLSQLGDMIVVETTDEYGREISHYMPGAEKTRYRYAES